MTKTGSNGSMRVFVTGGSGFIGAHLLDLLRSRGHAVLNFDTSPPPERHSGYWHEGSIMDAQETGRAMAGFAPTHVVHLAAYASMDASTMEEYRPNTDGTRNVLAAVAASQTVERVVVTSSQHVRAPGTGPAKHDTDFIPLALYGQSKVQTERITRSAGLRCSWTIIRPTAVWGPGHPGLADGLWSVIWKGRYLHPAHNPVRRSFGYVKNVVWQIDGLLRAPIPAVDKKVFYVGDDNISQHEWLDRFSRGLTGKGVRTVPLCLIHAMAVFGDVLKAVGLRFPMYGSRYRNLIADNPVPMRPVLDLLGTPPHTLDQGIRETVEWLRVYYEGKATAAGGHR